MNYRVLLPVSAGVALLCAVTAFAPMAVGNHRAPGVFAKGPDAMDESPDDIVGGLLNWKGVRKRVKKLESGKGWGKPRTGAVIGTGGTCSTVDMTIYPAKDSYFVASNADAEYSKGVIVAKIENNTDCDGVSIPLPAHHTGVWIVRFDNAAGAPVKGKAWVVDLDHTVLFMTKEAFLDVPSWTLGSCGISDAPKDEDVADIKRRITKCYPPIDPKQKPELQARAASLGALIKARPFGDDDGTLWFDCSQVCCYATADF